jgi:hypothetical protein
MLDPFDFLAFEVATRYWTPAEQNANLVSLFGVFGLNRLLWLAVGVGVLALTARRFRPAVEEQRGRGAKEDERSVGSTPFPTVVPSASASGWLSATGRLAIIHSREIVLAPVFWALVASGLCFVTLTLSVAKDIFGTATLPMTAQVLDLAQGGFGLFILIIITFYAGELIWRERDVGMNDIVDATRAPTWVGFFGKLGALVLIAASMEVMVGLVAFVSQVGRGYFAIEWRLYAIDLFVIDLSRLVLLSVLALTVQVVVNHKYLGHTAMVLYFILNTVLRGLGVEEPLFRYASAPPIVYSDMNGYGSQAWPLMWFRLYWSGFAVLLVIGAYALFVRGRETGFGARFAQGRTRLRPAFALAVSAGALLFLGAGGFIYWNTHVLNRYQTAKDGEREQAAYEKTYKKYADTPQPTIVSAEASFDVFPEERRLEAKGTYGLKNKGDAPVTRVMLNLPDTVVIRKLAIGGATPAKDSDPKVGVHFIDLTPALEPGATATLDYELEFAPKGFSHGTGEGHVVGNGTFFNNFSLPIIGYSGREELSEDGDRKDYGLAPKERMAPRDDPKELRHNYIRQDSDFVTFSATVSTSADQLAFAPGYLEKEWTEGNRRFFRYTMDQPILNFFSVLSARYATRRDEWNGVKLEIDYHPAHTANLDRMMQGMKDALAYCSEAFGPYQHHQARIIEFPRYQHFAQSFPNTIPYSEGVGFIARVRDDDPDDVDYPYYVTAHEIAHQWWAHQVVGANVRGATMTSESMAQYAALMVMKKKYGKEKMRRFLKFELDGYLRGRVMERKKELPLAQNENQQYIHYQKASLAMYALQDFLGEDVVNGALRKVVEKWKFQGPPYATAKDLLDAFREVTPPEKAYLLDDLFETITLYDNHVESASMKQNAQGSWDVTMQVVAKKLRSDDKGTQTELDFEDWMDVGALDEKGAALHLEKQKVKKGSSTLTFTSAQKPAKVGLDPLNVLIDRESDDNVVVPGS